MQQFLVRRKIILKNSVLNLSEKLSHFLSKKQGYFLQNLENNVYLTFFHHAFTNHLSYFLFSSIQISSTTKFFKCIQCYRQIVN